MTALKIVVGCVSIVVFGMLVAVPYRVNYAAGCVCVAAGIVGALGALSARFSNAMDRVGIWVEKHPGWLGGSLGLLGAVLALLSKLGHEELSNLVLGVFGLGVLWSLLTGWLCYKVVQTLVRPTAAA